VARQFPGYDGRLYLRGIDYSVTEKEGRIYAFHNGSSTRTRCIIIYNPQGDFLRMGFAIPGRKYYDEIITGLVEPYKEVLGEYTGEWEYGVLPDSYQVWRASLPQKRVTQAIA
jgi:hypothetical protein